MAKNEFSAAKIFGEETENNVTEAGKHVEIKPEYKQNFPKPDLEKKTGGERGFLGKFKKRKLVMILAALLIFAVFTGFLLKQYSYSYLSHDDYGYATLSYVYWEDGMWGQDFSLAQLTHYLTEHYNRWGGRILSFAQTILLFKAGTPVVQAFNAIVLAGIFLLAFLLAQNAKRTKLLPVSALFACATFGLIGLPTATSGLYWYSASILYMVPVLYIFLGCILMYIMMLGSAERTVSVSKLLMLPFACVLMFFGGFSIEHNGMYAVVAAAAILVYATFRKRNPFVLVYGFPPFLSAVAGCRIMLMAVGNNSRKTMYADYYALSFSKQLLTSAKTISQTLFRPANMMFVILLALVCIGVALAMLRRKNNWFFRILACCDAFLALASVAVANGSIATDKIAVLMWIYLVFMAVTVSIWLFSSGKKQDFLIWTMFFGSLVSQGACLISPIFPDRCLVPFVLTFTLVATRLFNEYISIFEDAPRNVVIRRVCAVLVPVVVIGAFGAGKIFNGFKENDAVQSFNERTLKVVAYEYEKLNTSATKITLMKLKDDVYAGSTQPYGRDLIKDWMKIYYKLPANLQYGDFVYENYDEERLQELEEELQEKENRYFKKD